MTSAKDEVLTQGTDAKHEPSEAEKGKAIKWFKQAQSVAQTRNYDYAIECYVGGLRFWPDAVEEGHKPLRLIGVQRMATGGKKPGLTETMKHGTTGKDALKAMLNAAFLLAKDPTNVSYMEALLKNANKAHCDQTVRWMGEIFLNAIQQEAKVNPKRFHTVREIFEEMGDRCVGRGDNAAGAYAYEVACKALSLLANFKPGDLTIPNILRDLSGKLTILKGKYATADSFKESVQDAEAQAQLHDVDRLVQTEERIGELIARARTEYQANPGIPAKLLALVDLLTRRESLKDEAEAISLLLDEYKRTKSYLYKAKADDLRIRQAKREIRKLNANGDTEKVSDYQRRLLGFEIKVFTERAKEYPTDMGVRFQLAASHFRAGQFDEAIPFFQQSRSDPKHRAESDIYIGRCFLEKGYATEAISVLSSAAASYGVPGDEKSKEMLYWLGRAQEADQRKEEAMKSYGQLIQWDYNFRDVRDRMEVLRQK